MSTERLERLLKLTALLLETARPLAATEIRERLGMYATDADAFRRKFERDKAELRAMGVPIEVADVPGVLPAVEGYLIPKDRYYLRDPGLTADELGALRLAASLVRFDGLPARDGLLKLGGLVGQDDATGWGVEVSALPGADVAPLFGAIAARTPVRFTYRDVDRTVDPYRLDFQRGRWYLTGFDHVRGEERNFRLDRFASPIEVLDGPRFEPPETREAGSPFTPWEHGHGAPVVARVLVDEDQAPWVTGHLGADAVVEERSDGSVVVEMTVTDPAAFRSFVLSFLDHAEVLSPPELRREVVAWLEALA
jgi:proteasome accessory factor B